MEELMQVTKNVHSFIALMQISKNSSTWKRNSWFYNYTIEHLSILKLVMKSFINSEVYSEDIKKNHGVQFESGDIVLCIDIFLTLKKHLCCTKTLSKLFR